jgi:hypothetical protein
VPKRAWVVPIIVVLAVGFAAAAVILTWPRELPPPLSPDNRSEFVSDSGGFRFWPRSAPIEEGVTYRFDTGHCGLNHLPDFDGSFWDAVNPNTGEEPIFFYNGDVGTIVLVGPKEARYTSSSGQEVKLIRIDGPVVTDPCA